MIERRNETIKHDFAMEFGANLRWWLIISGDIIVNSLKILLEQKDCQMAVPGVS